MSNIAAIFLTIVEGNLKEFPEKTSLFWNLWHLGASLRCLPLRIKWNFEQLLLTASHV